MCAIAGIMNLETNPETIDAFRRTMYRRGPDDFGVFTDREATLLHARLAVMDPMGGRQPMHLHLGQNTYSLIYNGELYNTRELRQELEKLGHRFISRCDTEVVLHAYAQWGRDCLEKFNGIFAFAVWESRDRRLFLARDRIGVKPLFYSLYRGGLLFASEIKTILAYPGVPRVLDMEGAAQILLLGPGRIPGSGVLSGIHELEPGCWAVWENGKLEARRYWKLRDAPHTDSFAETVERVRALVEDAVVRQMEADVPVGTFLSGGLDSSLISAICAREMRKKGKDLDTFSLDYENNDKFFVPGKFQPSADSDYIGIMEDALHCSAHHVKLTAEELADALEESTMARDLPGMADVDFSLLLFCKQIRKHVTVALSGECADEIFGGYPWYRDPQIREQAGFPWAQSTDQRGALMHHGLAQKIHAQEYVMSMYRKTLDECDILPENSPLERRMKQMVNLNFRWFMQTLLDRKDRMSMYASLEVRVPFCDYRIAEYLYRVPWEMKDHGGYEKGLLRTAAQGLLPEQILWRKKSPYPKTYDPEYLHLMRQRLSVLMDDPAAPLWELMVKERVEALSKEEMPWPWYGQLMRTPQTIAYLLQIDAWIRHYGVDLRLS